MSENVPSGQKPQASGEGTEDVVKYESYAKLLGEKKKQGQELAEYKAKLDQYEQEKLEAEGKLKEANENLKKMLEKTRSEQKNLVRNVMDKTIKSQFQRVAEKLGCVDPDTAYKVVSFDDLEVTEDLEFDSKKLESKLQELTKSKPFLFKKDVNLPPDLVPKGVPKKSLAEMSAEELKEQLKNIK